MIPRFRCWDKKNKRMVYDFTITSNGQVALEFDQFGADVELMQSTGLKDSKGREIFEGDIVVKDEYIWFDKDKPNYRGTVEWIYSQWQVVAHCINPEKRGISDGMNEGLNDDGVEEGKKSDWIILGNIFQNPDLLTKGA